MNWLVYGGIAALAYYFFVHHKGAAPPKQANDASGGTLTLHIPQVPIRPIAHVGDVLIIEGLAPLSASNGVGWAILGQPTVFRPLSGSQSQFALIGPGELQLMWPDTQSFPAGEVLITVAPK